MKNPKLCIVVTDSMNIWSLYRDQFKFFVDSDYDVTVISSPGIELDQVSDKGVRIKPIKMKRGAAPLSDLFALIQFSFFFLTNRFDIISISTPKASLLASIAAKATLQRSVVFTVRGRVYENKTGFKRKIFEKIDKVICHLSTSVISISNEIRYEFEDKNICAPQKISVLGKGSSNGVDLNRFSMNQNKLRFRYKWRHKKGVSTKDYVFLYSGRLRREKGINELISVFKRLSNEHSNIYLLIQGKEDVVDPISDDTRSEIESNERIFTENWSEDNEFFFAVADLFVFPTYREGFGNVALEASAMELPVIGFDVVGLRESVLNGSTGRLCTPFDEAALKALIDEFLNSPQEWRKLGQKGRERVISEFDSEIVWRNIQSHYEKLMNRRCPKNETPPYD